MLLLIFLRPLYLFVLLLLFKNFSLLSSTLSQRRAPLFITHLRSHSQLPGPLVHGNAQIDSLLIAHLQAAEQEHALHHTNSSGLQ